VYAVMLDKRYGLGTAERLIHLSNVDDNKQNRQELEDIIEKYKEEP